METIEMQKETFGNLSVKVDLKSQNIPIFNVDYQKGNRETMDRIWKTCLEFSGISADDPLLQNLRGHPSSKRRLYCVTRQVAHYLGKKHTILSLRDIGRLTGGKHHSTVYHSCNEIPSLLFQKDKFVMELVRFAETKLGLSEEPSKKCG